MKQPTARLRSAWMASVSETYHVELDKLPSLNNTKEQKRSPERLLVELVFFFSFYSNQMSKRLLGDSLLDRSDENQTKSNEKHVVGVS